MATSIIGVISSILVIVTLIWRYCSRKNAEKRRQAEQARKDLDEAHKTDDPGKFLDAFGRMR